MDPLLFGAYVALFVAILYAAAHFVSIRLFAVQVRDGNDRRTTGQRHGHGQGDN